MTVTPDMFAARLRSVREAGRVSQAAVADAMRERGHKWSQATVWSIEGGGRGIQVDEWLALSEFLPLGDPLADCAECARLRKAIRSAGESLAEAARVLEATS